ncbi:MAG: ATP-binding protein [Peptococcaceae bacterium]|nr:ATP-binding protein [Peptococcaceae bacterium]MDH7524174.1 ATP-binding protein [Peptococcaceae bacterium]
MGYQSIQLNMTPELFDRSIKASPKDAVKELIWNSCDADAKNIEVSFEIDNFIGVDNVTAVTVKDDGTGIPFERIQDIFGRYGSSDKTYCHKSPNGRVYHGKLGQGRYKCFAIGTFLKWKTVYQAVDSKKYSYEININSGSRLSVDYSEKPELVGNDVSTGTVATITGILEDNIGTISKLADNQIMIPDILSTFAPYLLAYNDISLTYNDIKIDPEHLIKKRDERDFVYEYGEKVKESVSAKAVAIRWIESYFSKLYICGESGVVFDERDYTTLQKNDTSIYLLSSYYEKMHQENTLAFGKADPVYDYFVNEARKFAREFTQDQEVDDATAEIIRIKEEGIYPYPSEPSDEMAKVEQRVFDVFAVEINRAVPQLRTSNKQTKKLTYRLIKEAINTNPSSIQTILTEVFNLSQQQQDDLAELLKHTTLTAIIDTAKTVADRLTFIYMLEQLVYNDSIGKPIKERTQFHKILLKELWIFGEKYYLGTSDFSLKNLLKAHIQCLGRDDLIPEIPPEATEDLTRIPDICLFQQSCPDYERYEHLVIELKRPTLTLTLKELDQKNKFRYEFLRKKLNYEVSNDPNFTMDYLLSKHAELFPKADKEAK